MRRYSLLLLVLLGLLPDVAGAQLHEFNERDRNRGRVMLNAVTHDVREHFWDPSLKGLQFDSLVAVAEAEIRQATGYGQMNGSIAKVMMALDDSHTRFWPPTGVNTIVMGWTPYAVGDSVYLRTVEPWARVAPYELHVGDRLVAVDGWRVERRRIWDLIYLRRYVQPRETMDLIVEGEDGAVRTVRVPVIPIQGKLYFDLSRLGGGSDWSRLFDQYASQDSTWDSRFVEPAPGVLYWRLRSFGVSDDHVRAGLRRARGKGTLILDLRGNSGGYVRTLATLLARVAHRDQMGDTLFLQRERQRVTAEVVEEASERERWNGRLIVLVDSESMSASEAFADAVQRLGLGTVIGDRTPGFLTMASGWSHLTREGSSIAYGASIAVAMLERPDGSRVEGNGVIPDELVQPTPQDLALRRDPVLARALQIAGLDYDPVKAADHSRDSSHDTRDW